MRCILRGATYVVQTNVRSNIGTYDIVVVLWFIKANAKVYKVYNSVLDNS